MEKEIPLYLKKIQKVCLRVEYEIISIKCSE